MYNWNQPIRHIEIYSLTIIPHKNDPKRSNSVNLVLPFLISPLSEPRGQKEFCKNLIANLFEKGENPCTEKLPDVKMKRQLLDHYLKGICSLTSNFGIYTKEIISPNTSHIRYLIQIDDVDLEISKVFTQFIKNIQHPNTQRANSIFTNDVFSLIYSYITILDLDDFQSDSPTQISRHTVVRQEIHKISKFLNAI